jgi:hypothetical protein
MAKKISGERHAAFYVGTALAVIGVLLVFSVLLSGAQRFGDFSDFEVRARSESTRALVGMALIVVGCIVRGIGARGLAGSGLMLNPKRARRELEPFSRMAGGMLKDTLEEADVDLSGRGERVVMIKCAQCAKLNEADAKFCQECGQRF